MLNNKTLFLAQVYSCILLSACAVAADKPPSDIGFQRVISAARSAYEAKNNQGDWISVMKSLYTLKAGHERINEQYVNLLDYYLGDADAGILDEFITKQGRSILPLLHEKLGKDISCQAGFESICVKSKKERDERVQNLIQAINQGKVLCVDKTDC